MRALVCNEWGKPEDLTLDEVHPPIPGPGEIRFEVAAAGANFADTLMIAGQYQTKPPFPFTPGLEAAGTVVDCGEEVTGFEPGDRVMAMLSHGGFAEQAVAAASDSLHMPDGMSFETGAAFTTAYVSAHVAIRWVGELAAGETMLVLGAAGGIGLAAVEIGKAMGATVIAGASSAEKLAATREHGADEGINYVEEDLRTRVAELTDGRGVDVCFDPVGGDLFDPALSSLAWGGRILIVGFAGGSIPAIPANRLLVKNRSARGSSLRHYRWHAKDRLAATGDELLTWYREGKLNPLVSETYPLDGVVDALQALAGRRAIGKLVIMIGQD